VICTRKLQRKLANHARPCGRTPLGLFLPAICSPEAATSIAVLGLRAWFSPIISFIRRTGEQQVHKRVEILMQPREQNSAHLEPRRAIRRAFCRVIELQHI
jgi:hypothetical protein